MPRFILTHKTARERAMEACRLAPDGWVVEVKQPKDIRSSAQNRLVWVWNTFIAGETGETKEEVHERMKRRFLVPIFTRDDPAYAEMIAAVNEVHRNGLMAQAKLLSNEIVRLTSTSRASVKQMTEYLTDMEHGCNGDGIYLPHTEDYHDAF